MTNSAVNPSEQTRPMMTSLDDARALDADLTIPPARRDQFHIPTRHGREVIYLCGNSLGLQPRATRGYVEDELDDWRDLAVDAHFEGKTPWYSYHETLRGPMSRIVGAHPDEIVMMNSLTVNLHLMMMTFYRPQGRRTKVLMESPAFPSDTYAIHSHLHARGVDPVEHVITIDPIGDRETLDTGQFVEMMQAYADEIALVLVGGVNYYTGQVMDMATITEHAHRIGAQVGFDCAHAAGNVPLSLHDWNVDFACWCTYKYLNGSPGAVAGCFIHERHAKRLDLPRFAGWWGNDPHARFRMHLNETFIPMPTADGWQLSNPPILAMAPLRASFEIFDQTTMDELQRRSRELTGQLRSLLEDAAGEAFEIITPAEPEAHGCQLSIRVHDDAERRFAALSDAGIIGDVRPPDVIRLSPTPLYNTFEDVWRTVGALRGMTT